MTFERSEGETEGSEDAGGHSGEQVDSAEEDAQAAEEESDEERE